MTSGTPNQNPEMLARTGIRLNSDTTTWPATSTPRRALVHAYGLGGVNASIVVEQSQTPHRTVSPSERAEIVALSARTPTALRRTAARLAAHLQAQGANAPALADIAMTLRTGRHADAERWTMRVASLEELVRALEELAHGEVAPHTDAGDRELQALRSTLDAKAWRERLTALPPAAGARRIALPGPVDDPLRFPLDGQRPKLVNEPAGEQADHGSSVVANFYDYVTRPRHAAFDETYLTLAPFPEPVPGFSWTSCMQDPAAHGEHHRIMLERQREMREVAFADVDFSRVGRMLDIGCGLGTDLITLAQRYPHLTGVGYTLSREQAQAANQRIADLGLGDRLQVFRRDSSKDAFPGSFDLVIGFEVAHHVADKDGLFANIEAALVEGGDLVLADTMAGTVAPVSLPEVGSYTLPPDDYADLFTQYALTIISCVDLSSEIANFLDDPAIDQMLAQEERVAAATGRARGFSGAAAVQRSWHAFGHALRDRLMLYVLVHARHHDGPDVAAAIRLAVGAS